MNQLESISYGVATGYYIIAPLGLFKLLPRARLI
jgi:hypothetical protein